MPSIDSFIEDRELVTQAQELYEFVKFVATSTDSVGRSALLFMPMKEYHPIVLSTARDLISKDVKYNK